MANQQTAPTQPESLPTTVDDLALTVLLVYQAAEVDLVTGSGKLIADTVRNPAESPYLYGRLHSLAGQIRDRVRSKVTALANQVADTAARNGNLTAVREVADFRRTIPDLPGTTGLLPHDRNAARLIAQDLASKLEAAALRITRFADDAYRAATVSSSLSQILNRTVAADAQAQAWRELSARGVRGFTDSRGREWSLATYVEMATRTATQRAYNASHRDRLTKSGISYFTISATGRPCPLCAPWEGRVLADSGAGIAVEDGHTFAVSATVEEATAAGLFHPNCKHTLAGYIPGTTVLRKTAWTRADEAKYKATQRLRSLERRIRADRLVHASALNDMQKAQAARDLRRRIAEAKDFADANGLLYRPRRTLIELGNKP